MFDLKFNPWKRIFFEADVPGGPTEPEPAVEPGAGPSAGGDPTPEPIVEIDGQQYTAGQLQQAIQAANTLGAREAELNQKQMEMNAILNAISQNRTGGGNVPHTAQPHVPQGDIDWTQFANALLDNPDQAGQVAAQWLQGNVGNLVQSALQEYEVKNQFLTKYPDYNKVTSDPSFQRFKSQMPYMSDVNAYFAFKLENAGNQVNEAKTQGAQQAIDNLKAKGQVRILTGAGSPPVAEQKSPADMSRAEALKSAIELVKKQREIM